jgi:uncharacterized protein (DUF1697 family)
MTKYVAFLRAVNVSGNNMIPMSDLKLLCENIGLRNVRTYIQSGNVLFESDLSEMALVNKLERAVSEKIGRHIPTIIRTVKELENIVLHNPFPAANAAQVGILLFSEPVPKDFSSDISTTGREEVVLGCREVYIHYPDGMGRSKLKLPRKANEGTMRNMNTISKLARMNTGG